MQQASVQQQVQHGGSLRFNGIGKTFPGVKALSDINFEARPGSVHALMGENGAGKSTLLKILGGSYQPNSGDLQIGDQHLAFKSTADSIAAGVAVIHQELHLVPEMSVAENLLLGHMPNRWGMINRRAMVRRARELLKGLADEIDPNTRLGDLSLGQRQLVEIAKAMSRNAHVIAFDEPTSSLSAREIDRLMAIITRLRDEGRVILYVSHRMEEIFRVCDAVTVFKDGRFVRTFEDMADLDHDRLVTCMVGRDIQDIYNYRPRQHQGPSLRVTGLMGPGLQEPVSFAVEKGEILGFFGLVGAGRTEMFRMLSGLTRSQAGALQLEGKPLNLRSPRDAIDAGILLCPEDRKKEGIVPLSSVAENINIGARPRHVSLGTAERQDAFARTADALSVGRQSAEGHSGPLAVDADEGAVAGRAHPGHRHRRQIRDLSDHPQPRRRWHCGHRGVQRPDGGDGHFRPDSGHE